MQLRQQGMHFILGVFQALALLGGGTRGTSAQLRSGGKITASPPLAPWGYSPPARLCLSHPQIGGEKLFPATLGVGTFPLPAPSSSA